MSIGFFASGCAKTVTQKISFGEQMQVKVTLRGNADNQSVRYFLVLAESSALAVPLPPPDNMDFEFIEPGDEPVSGTDEAYYLNFYGTWAGYIVLEPAGFFLVKGPFIEGQTPTREPLANFSGGTRIIEFDFRLSRIFDAVPERIYFDFISVPWPEGLVKLAADNLTAASNYIAGAAGAISLVEDMPNLELEAPWDIEECRIEIN